MLYKKDFFSQKVTIYSTLHGAHPQTGPALETEEKNTPASIVLGYLASYFLVLHIQTVVQKLVQ